MKHLLSAGSLAVLKRVASEKSLCAFDFDGTLAPIVANPEQAAMRARTRELLDRLAALYPCIVLSGRARNDLLGKLKGVPMDRAIGSHGADTGRGQKSHELVAEWRVELEAKLATISGLWIEDKDISLAVHYRQCADKVKARRSILAAARPLKRARILGGKLVVNIVPADAPNKGDALDAERKRLGCDWVLYVGDDENDEDAFALDGNLVPVRVGFNRLSNARFYLRTQAEVDKLLELLVRMRETSGD